MIEVIFLGLLVLVLFFILYNRQTKIFNEIRKISKNQNQS